MSSSKNLEYKKTSFLNKSNSAFIEQMYVKYVNNDPNLPESWKKYFIDIGDDINSIVKEVNGPSWSPRKNKIDESRILENEIELLESQNKEIDQKDIVASNSNSIALFKSICNQKKIPYQSFVMRSDMACGSTIGPMTSAGLGIDTLDIGLASFGMHSIREMAGAKDPELLLKAVTAFYNR